MDSPLRVSRSSKILPTAAAAAIFAMSPGMKGTTQTTRAGISAVWVTNMNQIVPRVRQAAEPMSIEISAGTNFRRVAQSLPAMSAAGM